MQQTNPFSLNYEIVCSGVSLDAHKRIQVNVPLKQNDAMTLLKNVREVK